MKPPNQIVIVDDHTLFREGLKLILEMYFDEAVITEAPDGKSFLEMLGKTKPDIVLMDINMPGMDGAEATAKALGIYPDLNIIALSMFGDEEFYQKMIEAGVKGFVLKNSEMAEVKDAIETVLSGDRYFSRDLLYKVVKNIGHQNETDANDPELTEREFEILAQVCKGLSNQEIADKLFISKRTVDKHRANILLKTNSKNTAQLVMNAIKNRWISL